MVSTLPVVFITHSGKQNIYALAIITCNNGFVKRTRQSFYVPDRVNWDKVAEVSRNKYESAFGNLLADDNTN